MSTTVNAEAEGALRALYDEHAAALLGFALRLTAGDRGRAEDIVQETLVRAWQHTDTVDAARRPVRPWLFTVAHRIAIDQHRRRSARPAEFGGDYGEQVLLRVADAVDIEAGLDRILVLDALAALSAEHRDVIVETYYGGHTMAEVAQALQIPIGTVKSRTFYALKALRLALNERGVTT